DRSRASADDDLRALLPDHPIAFAKIAPGATQHLERAAELGLAHGHMGDEVSWALARQGFAKSGRLGHEKNVMFGPYRLQVEELTDVAAARRRETDTHCPMVASGFVAGNSTFAGCAEIGQRLNRRLVNNCSSPLFYL